MTSPGRNNIPFVARMRTQTNLFFGRYYGNSLGILTNLKYAMWKLANHKPTSLAPELKTHLKNLREKGFCILPSKDVSKLAELVSQRFEGISRKKSPYLYLPGDKASEITEQTDLNGVFQEALDIVRAFYSTEINFHWSVFNRLHPGETIPDDSTDFHVDDCPVTSMKAMLYLTDADENSAALRILNREITKKVMKSGYLASMNANRREAMKKFASYLNDSNTSILSAPKGTIVLFDNNVIHKGVPPLTKPRDTVLVQFYPGHISATKSRISESFQKEITTGPNLSWRNIFEAFISRMA